MKGFYPEDKWVEANGLQMHYLDWGGDRTKKPLVLVHGIGGHAHMFDNLAPKFTDDWHVVALDSRGCGDTDWSPHGYSAQSQAEDIASFALNTGLYPFGYYGHSQGSRVGMPLGAYHGDLVSHLILGDYGPMPDPSPAGKEIANQRMTKGTTERPRGFFSPQMAFDWHNEQTPKIEDTAIWDLIKNTYRTNWDGILVPKTDPEIRWLLGRTALKEGPFLWDCVKKISCRTLVMRGESTNVLDRAQANMMVAEIPNGNGSTVEIKEAGHGLHNDNLEGTANAIRAFLMS